MIDVKTQQHGNNMAHRRRMVPSLSAAACPNLSPTACA